KIGEMLDTCHVRTDGAQAVLKELEVDLDGVSTRIDAHVGHTADRYAPVSDRAGNVQPADVLGEVGDQTNHFTAPQSLNEEQSGRQHHNHRHHDEQAQPRVAFFCSHHHPRGLAAVAGDDRVKKPWTNGLSEESRSVPGSPRATMPFAALSSTIQVLATRKMLGSSWVTMTTVMPRSRLSVRM